MEAILYKKTADVQHLAKNSLTAHIHIYTRSSALITVVERREKQ